MLGFVSESVNSMATRSNHSFTVGETYQDRLGTYRVISIKEDSLVYEYADGTRKEHSAEAKWRIHQNIVSEQNPSFPVG